MSVTLANSDQTRRLMVLVEHGTGGEGTDAEACGGLWTPSRGRGGAGRWLGYAAGQPASRGLCGWVLGQPRRLARVTEEDMTSYPVVSRQRPKLSLD